MNNNFSSRNFQTQASKNRNLEQISRELQTNISLGFFFLALPGCDASRGTNISSFGSLST